MADTTNTTGTGEITGASENVAEDAVLAGAEGRDVLVGQAGQGETVQVTDESQEISVDPGDNFVLPDGIALGDIDFQQAEGSLVIVLPSGSEITFTDFFIIAGEEEDGGLPPVLTLSDGTVMESPLVIAQIDDFDPNAVAAATATPPSRPMPAATSGLATRLWICWATCRASPSNSASTRKI